MSQTEDIEREIKRHDDAAKEARQRLAKLHANCAHEWGKTEEKYERAYHYPGGGKYVATHAHPTDGRDAYEWVETSVGRKERSWWERTCKKCGKLEKTETRKCVKQERVVEHAIYEPDFK